MNYNMKAILMSIKPKHVANILNELKTLEIRKRFPNDYIGWVYIYCTKDGYLSENDLNPYTKYFAIRHKPRFTPNYMRGRVVARFWCDKVEKIRSYLEPEQWYMTSDLGGSGLLQKSCLSFKELDDYLLSGGGYAIHITKLEIFDRPKEISEFKHLTCRNCKTQFIRPLSRAPQSFCYIEI